MKNLEIALKLVAVMGEANGSTLEPTPKQLKAMSAAIRKIRAAGIEFEPPKRLAAKGAEIPTASQFIGDECDDVPGRLPASGLFRDLYLYNVPGWRELNLVLNALEPEEEEPEEEE